MFFDIGSECFERFGKIKEKSIIEKCLFGNIYRLRIVDFTKFNYINCSISVYILEGPSNFPKGFPIWHRYEECIFLNVFLLVIFFLDFSIFFFFFLHISFYLINWNLEFTFGQFHDRSSALCIIVITLKRKFLASCVEKMVRIKVQGHKNYFLFFPLIIHNLSTGPVCKSMKILNKKDYA